MGHQNETLPTNPSVIRHYSEMPSHVVTVGQCAEFWDLLAKVRMCSTTTFV